MDDDRVIIYAYYDNPWMSYNGIAIRCLIALYTTLIISLALLSFYELRVQSTKLSTETVKLQTSYLIAVCIQVFFFLHFL